ncbi:uncharacterized protein LOC142317586 [Lycorma delicatula]|uniref:uncharacterized protein LOC142317586 n=1 Tax=Lycorma delicatula TaxID=130591 RepID=UPI003F514ADF
MIDHLERCRINPPAKVLLPVSKDDGSQPVLKFKNFHHIFPLPIVCYADFECILKPVATCCPNPKTSYTVSTEHHIPMSYCVYFVTHTSTPESVRNVIPSVPILYRGKEAARSFMELLHNVSIRIDEVLKQNRIMEFTDRDRLVFESVVRCQMCDVRFSSQIRPVRDHCHITGRYRAALCNKCNLQRSNKTFIPVFIHNSSNYDSHFIVRELGYDEKRISVIPNSTEKYISFSKRISDRISIRFVDTFRFMASSLDYLVKTLPDDKFFHIKKFFNQSDLSLVTRKGVYPYEYTSSWDTLEETSLPPKEKFYSSLTETHITDEDYNHAKLVWDHFKINNLGEYSDLYLKCDVLLLADVFENFRTLCLSEYGLDCAHYFTLPGFSFDAMLYKTRVQLELITDYDIYMFLEKGIRGGISVCIKKYSKANNPYIADDFDPNLPSKYLMNLDANNLYGWALSQCLPYKNIQWVDSKLQNSILDNIMSIKDDGTIGYIFEVDVEYPVHLHDLHCDFPFLPANEIPPFSKYPKLIPSLKNKSKYVCHFSVLKQAIRNGLHVTKIHKLLQFQQSPWLKNYIDLNTANRQSATNEFEKDLFKLMNNAVFGKCMENVRKRLNLELVSSEKRLMKLISKPSFKDRIIYDESLCAVQCAKEKILFDKPIYVGLTVLELSKTLMYDFHYDVMRRRFGSKISLMYMDTDSFFYEVETCDFYKDLQDSSFIDYFDTSDYPKAHPCFSLKNKKVIGKFKDECCGFPIRE